jgi:hypothetical protein
MADYIIVPLPRLKGNQVAVQSSNGTGYKTPAASLAGAMGRWSHRWAGYVMPASTAELFEHLYADGWRATVVSDEFIPPGKDLEDALPNLRTVKAYLRVIDREGRRAGLADNGQ